MKQHVASLTEALANGQWMYEPTGSSTSGDFSISLNDWLLGRISCPRCHAAHKHLLEARAEIAALKRLVAKLSQRCNSCGSTYYDRNSHETSFAGSARVSEGANRAAAASSRESIAHTRTKRRTSSKSASPALNLSDPRVAKEQLDLMEAEIELLRDELSVTRKLFLVTPVEQTSAHPSK